MLKKWTIFIFSFISAMYSYPISPHGSRLDYGRSSHSDGVGILAIIIVIAVVVLIMNINRKSSNDSRTNSHNYSEYYYLAERVKKEQQDRKDFEKGCFWLICIIVFFLLGIIINSLTK